MSNLGLRSGAKVQKRRRKVTICQLCSVRHVRCDRKKPACSKCIALGSDCVYIDDCNANGLLFGVDNDIGEDVPHKSHLVDVGLLAIDPSKSQFRYTTPAHWVSLLHEVTVLKNSATGNSCAVDIEPIAESDQLSRLRRLAFQYLPSWNDCGQLISVFFKRFNTMHMLLPLKDTLVKFDRLKARLTTAANGNANGRSDNFICVLFAILYAASVVLNDSEKYIPGQTVLSRLDSRKTDIAKYSTAASEALKLYNFPAEPSLPCLSTAVIMSVAQFQSSAVEAAASTAFLIRVAQSMGMHRDPLLFKDAAFSVEESEFRRRLWWSLLHLDASVSLGSGLPPSLTLSDYDISFPALLPSMPYNDMPIIVANGVYSFCRVINIILSDLYGPGNITDEKLIRLEKELATHRESMTARIVQVSNFKFESDDDGDNYEFAHKLQKLFVLLLKLLREKEKLITFQAISSSESVSEMKLVQFTRLMTKTQVVQSAVQLLQSYAQIANLHEFSGFLWHIRKYHQLHAIMIVLRDIYDFPMKPSYSSSVGNVDERIDAVENGLTATSVMGCIEGGVSEQQWLRLLRFKNLVWSKKFAEMIYSGHSTRQESENNVSSARGSVALLDETEGISACDGLEDTHLRDEVLNFSWTEVDWLSYTFGL
ncbi:hypothetical protein V1512DRAFT_265155 [Lipomyces arxii]|uniref:uncharacterized protein n=1 Tax=Lipomyces arxii TaxID=56418 RepID=UPI0034CDA5BF